MKNPFLFLNFIGPLYLDECYVYYDEPILSTCISKTGEKFLCMLCEEENRTWLLVSISNAQLILLKKNKISLRQAYEKSENGVIYEIQENRVLQNSISCYKTIDEINQDFLPDDDFFIDWKFDSDEKALSDIETIAKEENRDIMCISLEVDGSHASEIQCDLLAPFLLCTQNLLYSLASDKINSRGRISDEIKKDTSMDFTKTYVASFGMVFKSSQLGLICDESSSAKAIRYFTEFLNNQSDYSKLSQFIKDHSNRTIVKLRDFIRILVTSKSSINVEVATTKQYYHKNHYAHELFVESYKKLTDEIESRTEKVTISGKLVMADVSKNKFAFISNDDTLISGIISKNISEQEHTVPQEIIATFEQKIDANCYTSEEKYLYTLLEYKQITCEI